MSWDPTREQSLLQAVLALDSEAQREAFLNIACADSPGLRERVVQLLAAHADAERFFQEPALSHAGIADAEAVRSAALPSQAENASGERVGRYKLMEKIGEGGCGVVYVAEQKEPVRRRVALKIIKLGMDTRSVVARFEAERQALALMDHPNIAKVLDAGATDTGRPYFVMELVRGLKITDYCDQHQLATAERLDLFIQVCRAVQHAHQKGIIHRDLKPSNILVTVNDGVAIPKVIDFGIAKATEGRLTDKTVYTELHQFLGTPAYMSPEQAELTSVDIDTRSDIYSLGVLLYELLTGKTPFDHQELVKVGLDAMRQMIRTKEPPRPSTRLSTLAAAELSTLARARQSEPPKLIHAVRGDLDWIVMKCLEKDRGRRYETANGLVMDLQRHLRSEPVVARPPSTLYRLQKSVCRNKLPYTAATAVVLALSIGLGLATWMFLGERQAHDRAMTSEREAQQALYDSLVGQARATRLARRVGYRDRVFDLLGKAKALDVPHRNLAYLRNEAVACLGDFIGLMPATFTNFPSTLMLGGGVAGRACLDPAGKLAAFRLDDNSIQLREMPSGNEVGRFTGTNETFGRLCFNATGDQLQAVAFPMGSPPTDPKNWPRERLYSWGRLADGHWQQTGNRPLPGAGRLFANGQDVYANSCENGPELRIGSIEPDSPAEKAHLQVGDEIVGFAGVPVSSYDEMTNLIQKRGCQATPVIVKRGGGRVVLTITPAVDLATGRSRVGLWYDSTIIVRLFNAGTGALVPGYAVTNSLPAAGRFIHTSTPDRRLLAFESWDMNEPSQSGLLNLYEWKTSKLINQRHLSGSGDVNASPDGKYLAFDSGNGYSEIYTIPGLERIYQFKHNTAEQAAVFSVNVVALPMWPQRRICLWNLATREDVAWLDEPEPAAPASFSADGGLLLIVGDRYARLQRLNTPEKLDLAAHAMSVPGIAFSPDGARLASVDRNQVVRVYDSVTGHIVWQTNNLPGPGQCVSYSPDGRWLTTGDLDTPLISIWDADTGQRLLDLGTNRVGRTLSAQFSPDGHYLAAAGATGRGLPEIRIWEIEHGTQGQTNQSVTARLIKSFTGGGSSLIFAPDSRCLVFRRDRNLYMWKCTPSAELQPLPVEVGRTVGRVSFTPDGGRLLAMVTNGEVLTLDLATGAQVSSFKAVHPEHPGGGGLCLSPNGALLAVKSESGLGVDIWDPKTGKLCYSLPEETGEVYWQAWSPDSRRLAIARDSGNIAIWDLPVVGQILAGLGLSP
jgi:serine/threonine protein kinase/WD40 repeat protein